MGRRRKRRGNKFKPPTTPWEDKFELLLREFRIQFHRNQRFPRKNGRAYFADFWLPEGRIVIEIDGLHHATPVRQWRDRERARFLRASGVSRVIRLWNSEVSQGMGSPAVQAAIHAARCAKEDTLIDFCFVEDGRSR